MSPENDAFEEELARVLFHHIDEVDRAGKETLDGLLQLRTKSIDAAISRLRAEVGAKAARLASLDHERNEVSLTDLEKRRAEIALQVRAAEVDLEMAEFDLQSLESGVDETSAVQSDRAALGEATQEAVVVTHNANLAVVGDADQRGHCSYEAGAFTLTSGPLASLDTGELVIDVLEEARPAFENRRKKYEEVVVQPAK